MGNKGHQAGILVADSNTSEDKLWTFHHWMLQRLKFNVNLQRNKQSHGWKSYSKPLDARIPSFPIRPLSCKSLEPTRTYWRSIPILPLFLSSFASAVATGLSKSILCSRLVSRKSIQTQSKSLRLQQVVSENNCKSYHFTETESINSKSCILFFFSFQKGLLY